MGFNWFSWILFLGFDDVWRLAYLAEGESLLGKVKKFPFEFFSYGDEYDGLEDHFKFLVDHWLLPLRMGQRDLGRDWLLDLFLDTVAASSGSERSESVNFSSNEEIEES